MLAADGAFHVAAQGNVYACLQLFIVLLGTATVWLARVSCSFGPSWSKHTFYPSASVWLSWSIWGIRPSKWFGTTKARPCLLLLSLTEQSLVRLVMLCHHSGQFKIYWVSKLHRRLHAAQYNQRNTHAKCTRYSIYQNLVTFTRADLLSQCLYDPQI